MSKPPYTYKCGSADAYENLVSGLEIQSRKPQARLLMSEEENKTNRWQDKDGRWHEHCEQCGDCILCGPCWCEIQEEQKKQSEEL